MEKNLKIVIPEGGRLEGLYTFTKAKIESKEQWKIHDMIVEMEKYGQAATPKFMELVRQLNQICQIERMVFKNIVPTVGRTMIANNLTSTSPGTVMLLNYSALGSSNTAVANADTQLNTEVYRKQTASYTNSSNIAYVTAFYNATETTGTYHEAGLFAGASGTANSGVLFSHVLLNSPTGITKSSVETLTIDYTLTIS